MSCLSLDSSLFLALIPDWLKTTLGLTYQNLLLIDYSTVELAMHFIFCIISVLSIFLIALVYICLVALDPSKKGPLKPIKNLIPDQEMCSPMCDEDHVHTLRRYEFIANMY